MRKEIVNQTNKDINIRDLMELAIKMNDFNIGDEIFENNSESGFNKQFIKQNLAFRQVDIYLDNKNMYLYETVKTKYVLSVIIDKDSNIVCDTPYNDCFEVVDNILHINCTEEWTEDVWKDYINHVDVNYGNVEINIHKIFYQIFEAIKNNNIQLDGYGNVNIGIMDLMDTVFFMLLHKDTLITKIGVC